MSQFSRAKSDAKKSVMNIIKPKFCNHVQGSWKQCFTIRVDNLQVDN